MPSSVPGFSPRAAGASGSTPRAVLRALPLALLLAGAAPAWGFFNDRLEVYGSETITYDTNVFRLPDRAGNPAGQSGRSDRINVHTVGIEGDLPVSLQRFQASYARLFTRYQRFDHLDFDGHSARAAWLWVLTEPRIDGDVGYTEFTGLASFATFGGTTRDVMKTRQAFASANWLMTPRWLLHAGALATERTHDDPERRIHDIETRSLELRLSYLTPKESRLGVAVRVEDGGSPEARPFRGVLFDNSYRHYGVGIVGRWEPAGHTRLDARVDYVKREYEQFSDRDYSGPAWGITHTWTPTGKLTIVSTVRRDLAPLDDVQTAFVLSTGASIRPRWQLTEKFALVGHADYVRWDYKGDPIRGGDYHHNIRSAGVGFAWTPYRRVILTGNAQREVRTSSLGDADYSTNVYILDARVGF